MVLFSMTLEQQRQNFIDARLREGPYFPDLNIRKWLERQRTALVSVLDCNIPPTRFLFDRNYIF